MSINSKTHTYENEQRYSLESIYGARFGLVWTCPPRFCHLVCLRLMQFLWSLWG